MEDWTLIVATLFARGSCNKLLSADARRQAWIAADGYGRMTAEQLTELQLFEDWSHIRDCSEEGKKRVAASIRAELIVMARRRAARWPELMVGDDHYAKTVAQVVDRCGSTCDRD